MRKTRGRDSALLATPALWLAPLVVLAAQSAGCQPTPLLPCEPKDEAQVVCGLQNPEDLTRIPGSPYVLVSEFGSLEKQVPGAITLLDTRDEKLTPLFPQDGRGREPHIEEGPDWGSARCPGPPNASFSPHGIDLAERADGKLALYAVNHGGRESVEIFEVKALAQGAGYELAWRGCVPAQDKGFWNDVAALPDGGFVATHMFDKTHGLGVMLQYARALMGANTGALMQWSPKDGLHKLPGSDMPFPNGIVASRDGSELFVNLYMKGEVRRIERSTGKVLARASIVQPDNTNWTEQGTLLVASHTGGLTATGDCAKLDEGACPVAFEVIELDPRDMKTTRILAREGAPMGAATSAVRVGDELWLGSFASDRIMHVRL